MLLAISGHDRNIFVSIIQAFATRGYKKLTVTNTDYAAQVDWVTESRQFTGFECFYSLMIYIYHL